MKTMLALLFLPVLALAQTNIVWTTNWVSAVWGFRVVTGQVYNVEKSVLFHKFRGDIVAVLTNGVVIQKHREERSSYYPSSAGDPVRSGQFLGRNLSPPTPITRSEWVTTDELMFVKNLPEREPTVGKVQSGEAMRVGRYEWQGGLIECWDYGLPNWGAVVKTNGRVAFTISTNLPAKR